MMNQGTLNAESLGLIPVLTTHAGTCLTTENWQEAGIKTASFHLSSLLMKPGIEFLSTLPDLATYVGWNETLVLNASLPKMSADGRYTLCSQYDGRRTHYSVEEILALIVKLQPHMVILPEGVRHDNESLWKSLPETIFPFLPVRELPDSSETRGHGIYFSYDKNESSSSMLLQQIEQYKARTIYIGGELDLPLMLDLVSNGVRFVESDLPAEDARLGKVYCSEGVILLQDNAMTMQFENMDAKCQCPTCSQQLTRAYLHHLLEHTPLLCQRFLVQHNAYYCKAALS